MAIESGFAGKSPARALQTSICKMLTAAALATLAACADVPRNSPSGEEIAGHAAAISPDAAAFKYALVKVGDREATALSQSTSEGSLLALPRGGAQMAALQIYAGDIIAITIYEANSDAASHALFASGDASQRSGSGATLPSQQVDASGAIVVPFVGSVHVAGLTPSQAASMIGGRLAQRALEPQVVVSFVERRSDAVSVLGDVVSPIHFSIDPGGVTLLEAIARSGGAKSQSFETEVALRRAGQVYRANLGDVLNQRARDTALVGGDVVFLVHNPRFVTVFGATSDASGNSNITHRVTFETDTMTLSEALGKVNGLSDVRADPRQVYILRNEDASTLRRLGVDVATFNSNSIPTALSVNLAQAEGLFVATHLRLRSQDVIVAADAQIVDIYKLFTVVDAVTQPFEATGAGVAGFRAGFQ